MIPSSINNLPVTWCLALVGRGELLEGPRWGLLAGRGAGEICGKGGGEDKEKEE